MKKIIISLSILLFSLTPLRGDEKFAFEISSGYSFGSYFRKDYKLSFPLRFAMKYYISRRFALQGEIDYQTLVYRERESVLVDHEEKKYESFAIPYLDFIYLFKERKKITPYVGSGVGISHFVYYVPIPSLRVSGGFQYKVKDTIRVVFGTYLHYGVRGLYLSLRVGLEVR